MALHNQLPIYKQGYDLLSLASDAQQKMPRAFKASLGSSIHKECVEILVLIGRAIVGANYEEISVERKVA